jgi:hypothetical protein
MMKPGFCVMSFGGEDDTPHPPTDPFRHTRRRSSERIAHTRRCRQTPSDTLVIFLWRSRWQCPLPPPFPMRYVREGKSPGFQDTGYGDESNPRISSPLALMTLNDVVVSKRAMSQPAHWQGLKRPERAGMAPAQRSQTHAPANSR